MSHPVLIAGKWVKSNSSDTFYAANPTTGKTMDEAYPVSDWSDCDAALESATRAFQEMRSVSVSQLAEFLDLYADRIDERSAEICAMAHRETGLPVSPRLADVELPRTSNQLRQAAIAVRTGSWCQPTIDTATGIRSIYAALGPVAVFGPNNFPLAFGSISGGDFAAALAAGNPVIAKANSSHPATTKILAEIAQSAADETGMPKGIIQLIYRTSHKDGERLVGDSRLASVGYTGSRHAGLRLKSIADQLGKPIYLELSSVNPVFIMPGAIDERGGEIATELSGSCLLGAGQFCTSPGLIVMVNSDATNAFVDQFVENVSHAGNGVLLSGGVQNSLADAVDKISDAGAQVVCGGQIDNSEGFRFQNTVLKIDGDSFLEKPEVYQTEAFGNASLIVLVENVEQMTDLVGTLEGNLTGTIYTHSGNVDEAHYAALAPVLRQKVGRLLNDKMPTGVAVSMAMNHGGPFPATGHPAFSAVGMPQSIFRFAMLQSFDNVREHRLPELLRDENPGGINRLVNGKWTPESLIAESV